MSIAHGLRARQKGFTLIELIIVITILVVLGVVVVVLIDPAEILAQSRDSQRISDIASIKGATQLVLASGIPSNASTVCDITDAPDGTDLYGNATSTSGTSYVFSSLTTDIGTSGYNQSASTTAQSITGTGWAQIDYRTPSTGRALTSLPSDPTNTLTSGYFYRWGCNYVSGIYQYEIDTKLESAKYTVTDNKATKDGGNNSARYEVGNNLGVLRSY